VRKSENAVQFFVEPPILGQELEVRFVLEQLGPCSLGHLERLDGGREVRIRGDSGQLGRAQLGRGLLVAEAHLGIEFLRERQRIALRHE
jgi:hypothetical protein